MMRDDIRQSMQGMWRSVLRGFGLTDRELSGKHGPCPICKDGKDRFRFDDKGGHGTYICSVCGSGSGFDLLMAIKGWDFKTAANACREALGQSHHVRETADTAISDDERRALLRRTYKGSKPIVEGDEVDLYLRRRHLGRSSGEYPEKLRTHDRCEVSGVRGLRYLPAMLAIIDGPDGKPISMHRTYIRGGEKAAIHSPRKIMPGHLPEGAAVRLADPVDGHMAIAEGIETALAVTAMWRTPCWAALNSVMLAKWQPPEGVNSVHVIADNDANFTGQHAAYALARRLVLKHRVKATVYKPANVGEDVWDEWAFACAREEQVTAA